MNVQDHISNNIHSVTRIVTDVMQLKHDISRNDSLIALGLDSLLCMRIIIELEKEYHIEIEDDDLLLINYGTIASISDMVHRLVTSKH
jgi:acyl carrier protein